MTYKDMCKEIEKAGFLVGKNGKKLTAKEIFNYSPSGELFMIHEWYEQAKIINELKDNNNER